MEVVRLHVTPPIIAFDGGRDLQVRTIILDRSRIVPAKAVERWSSNKDRPCEVSDIIGSTVTA